MPTSTFFRLPEEKRLRLMDACWEECTRVRFTDVSINRIIAAAHIPRGSFYQYFTDKEDMIRYLLKGVREYFIQSLRDILHNHEGDLLSLPLGAFDRLVQQRGVADPVLARFIQVLRLNPGIETQSFLTERPGLMPEPLWDETDMTGLRRQDREYAEHVFFLGMAILGGAVVETLQEYSQREIQRDILQARIDLLRYGCAARTHEEETT